MKGSQVIIGWVLVLLVAATMAAAAPPEKGEVFKLTYGACQGSEMFNLGVRAQLGTEKPEGLTAEPKYKAKPQYGSLTLIAGGESKPFLVAIDKSTPAGETYDVLYIDRDRDGDLGEEKAITVGVSGGDFELAVIVNGKQINRSFTARVFSMTESTNMLILQDRGVWHGKATVGGAKLDIVLLDGNKNGVFNDALRLPEDGNGKGARPDMFLTKPMTGPGPDYGTMGICPATLEIGGKLYNVTVAADGSSIAFAPLAGPTATLTAPDGLSAIMCVGDRMVTVTARDGKLVVPAGKIRPFIYAFNRKDAAGREWRLMSEPDFAPKAIELPAGGSAAFPGKLPVQVSVKTAAPGKITAGGTVNLAATITDAAGGAIRLLPIFAKGEPQGPPAPVVIVIKQGEEVIARCKCEFG